MRGVGGWKREDEREGGGRERVREREVVDERMKEGGSGCGGRKREGGGWWKREGKREGGGG